jgi:hypothetical protein
MIDVLIKSVSVTYKCYEMYAHRGALNESFDHRYGSLSTGVSLGKIRYRGAWMQLQFENTQVIGSGIFP